MSVFSEDGASSRVKCNKAIVKIGSTTALALNVQITFQRQAEVVPTIGKERVVAIGMPQGELQIESILGKEDLSGELSKSGCDEMTVVISEIDECNSGKTITCGGVVISAATITMQGGRGYVANGVRATFTKLEM